VLFGISILTIFIYDLSFLAMLYRIFSSWPLGSCAGRVVRVSKRYSRAHYLCTEDPHGGAQLMRAKPMTTRIFHHDTSPCILSMGDSKVNANKPW